MAGGTDKDGAYAVKMDEWVVWETVEGKRPPQGARVNSVCILLLRVFSYCTISFHHSVGRGARTPRPAHSAMPRAEDLLCWSGPTEGRQPDLLLCIS
jgi:hypothetical protein